ncbi:MAG: hypothetical protein JXR94_14750 [Candidatus Hydrogenedentes bacterium]|nr:hypothetical protein [Candidatus Hydrogenedentota bacterium]
MKARRLVAGLALCVMFCLLATWWADTAYAGTSVQEQKGLGGVFQNKRELDEDKKPNGLKMALGIGSIFVMIAVVKYL